jgi:hypothetical protein
VRKGEINQPLFIMMGVLMMLENLPTQVVSPNSLAGFVRVTTFLDISWSSQGLRSVVYGFPTMLLSFGHLLMKTPQPIII